VRGGQYTDSRRNIYDFLLLYRYSFKMHQKLARIFKTSPYREIALFTVPAILLLSIMATSLVVEGSQQFSELAQAFLHGQTHFLTSIGGLGEDPIRYHGHVYWGEGPFPAVLLMPFVAAFALFHLFFYQGYLQWLLILGILLLIFKLARHCSYTKEDSLILMFGFALGSVFIGVICTSSSWFFAQVLTTFLLCLSLYIFYCYRKWWLLGILCALILMTRMTAAPIFLFFGLELWRSTKDLHQKTVRLVQLCLPMLVALCLLGLYNTIRFHSPFNGGFAYQLVAPVAAQSRSYGVFSPVHIPLNLYDALLGAPITVLRNGGSWILRFPYIRNNPFGMSIFITSPYVLYLFTTKRSSLDAQARNLLVAILVSAVLVFSYYGAGLDQFGARYTLDFMPELFLLFMLVYRTNHKRISGGMRTLLLGAGVTNYYLLCTFLWASLH
jgi:hypothetical protein